LVSYNVLLNHKSVVLYEVSASFSLPHQISHLKCSVIY